MDHGPIGQRFAAVDVGSGHSGVLSHTSIHDGSKAVKSLEIHLSLTPSNKIFFPESSGLFSKEKGKDVICCEEV